MSQRQKYPLLKFHGNPKTMNLNYVLLTNIQSSLYFKRELIELTQFSEVVDEIYYKVNHLEAWEKGSDIMTKSTKVYRGIGGSGIPSTAFCILYKLHTLKLTQKQVVKLILHEDSPYIRGIGFLYLRFTQPPERLWGWFKDFIFDEETLYVKSDNRLLLTVGDIVKTMLFENDWFSSWLPRIPVSNMKDIRRSYDQAVKGRQTREIKNV